MDGAIRWFYGDLAGLCEVPSDVTNGVRLRFRSARIELRVNLVDRPRVDTISLRVTIAVQSLGRAANRLLEAKWAFERFSGLMFTDRTIQTIDPAGHRVALRQVWDYTLP